MSLAENKTFDLWKSFMPIRKDISNNLNSEIISMTVYKEPLKMGDLNQVFDKWAAIEVSNFENIPAKIETFILKSGLYAVFNYKGLNTDNSIFIYIYSDWLPKSEYLLDDRPNFEILGDKNGDPNSEEEIWIPIKIKE